MNGLIEKDEVAAERKPNTQSCHAERSLVSGAREAESKHPDGVSRTMLPQGISTALSTTSIVLSALMFAWLRVPAAGPQQKQVSSRQFTLVRDRDTFLLRFVANDKRKQIIVPREWLIPRQEEKDEEAHYATSFNYAKEVTAFPIGNGRVGLHLSSYKIQDQGSAQAGAGRDVFLIFDPRSSTLLPGGIERGVTKQRVRSQGCFAASDERYFLGDIDGDGLADIGVVKEEIRCVETTDGDVDRVLGPFYKQHPVTWYVFKENAWKLDPQFSGKFPERYEEMPWVGIDRGPVEFVGCTIWQTCERAKWPTGDSGQLKEHLHFS
jgi:hypothetical protein